MRTLVALLAVLYGSALGAQPPAETSEVARVWRAPEKGIAEAQYHLALRYSIGHAAYRYPGNPTFQKP